ncbi:hypothetical protein AB4Z14_13670 [Terrabacter sp. 2TAF16]|uniref:hypothetical protein n=1 Tax=Terrabacter sp. 2TAF16 TaxID=3233008 RepID=UPI003F9AABF6
MFVYSIATSSRHSLLRGNVADWLRTQRVPVQRARSLKGWTIRTEHVGDVVARAERDGITVRMMGSVE